MNFLSAVLSFLLRSSTVLFSGLRWLIRSRKNRKLASAGVLGAMLCSILIGELVFEHRHLPWRPLVIDDRAGFATGFKLRMIELGPGSWCRNLLDDSKLLNTTAMEAVDGKGSCGWDEAYHLDQSDQVNLTGKSQYAMQCGLVAGAHIWIRSIDYHAREILGSPLAQVHHVGTYSCRRMNNSTRGPMSKHAFAKAWDVTGFELQDGRVISVLKHWNENKANRKFLRAVHDDACRVFNVTLGPNYNAAHRDHFHVDIGGGASCR